MLLTASRTALYIFAQRHDERVLQPFVESPNRILILTAFLIP